MINPDRILRLLAERREGSNLPAVFESEWLFACNACEIKNSGEYLTERIKRRPCTVNAPQREESRRRAPKLKERLAAARLRLTPRWLLAYP